MAEEWFEDQEGQVALDVYQTDDHLVIKAPIAGVHKDDLEISITDEQVTIKGIRHDASGLASDRYFIQECYWGGFARAYVLPVSVDSEHAQALLKDGLLTITIPKLEKSKLRQVQIQVA